MTGAPTTGHGPSDDPNTGIAKSALAALRARVAKLEAALEDIRDAQWLWHGGRGYTRSEHAEHCEELKEMARAALKDAPQ